MNRFFSLNRSRSSLGEVPGAFGRLLLTRNRFRSALLLLPVAELQAECNLEHARNEEQDCQGQGELGVGRAVDQVQSLEGHVKPDDVEAGLLLRLGEYSLSVGKIEDRLEIEEAHGGDAQSEELSEPGAEHHVAAHGLREA